MSFKPLQLSWTRLRSHLEMGTNHRFGNPWQFGWWPKRCSVISWPAPSSRCPLRNRALASLPHPLWALILRGCLLKEVGHWVAEHLFGHHLPNWWFMFHSHIFSYIISTGSRQGVRKVVCVANQLQNMLWWGCIGSMHRHTRKYYFLMGFVVL